MTSFPSEYASVISDKKTLLFYVSSKDGRINFYSQADDEEAEAENSPSYQSKEINPVAESTLDRPPLAAVAWSNSNSKEVRIYYRSSSNKLVEWCRSSNRSKPNTWYPGALSDLKTSFGTGVTLAPGASIEATVDDNTKQLKVFAVPKDNPQSHIYYTSLSEPRWVARQLIH